jgi:hypothetical protein
MKVIYTDRGRPWPEAAQTLGEATGWLEDAIGASAARVTAEWDRTTDDKGHAQYNLRISDSVDRANASYAPDEIRSPRHMRFRLLRLWGDLLQARDHRQLQRLLSSSGMET